MTKKARLKRQITLRSIEIAFDSENHWLHFVGEKLKLLSAAQKCISFVWNVIMFIFISALVFSLFSFPLSWMSASTLDSLFNVDESLEVAIWRWRLTEVHFRSREYIISYPHFEKPLDPSTYNYSPYLYSGWYNGTKGYKPISASWPESTLTCLENKFDGSVELVKHDTLITEDLFDDNYAQPFFYCMIWTFTIYLLRDIHVGLRG